MLFRSAVVFVCSTLVVVDFILRNNLYQHFSKILKKSSVFSHIISNKKVKYAFSLPFLMNIKKNVDYINYFNSQKELFKDVNIDALGEISFKVTRILYRKYSAVNEKDKFFKDLYQVLKLFLKTVKLKEAKVILEYLANFPIEIVYDELNIPIDSKKVYTQLQQV